MKLAFIGDLGLFGVNSVEQSDYRERFHKAAEYLRTFDYVVGNLEVPLTDTVKTCRGKSAYLKASPANMEILQYLGVTHVNLANNHLFDYGRQGFNDTLVCLDRGGIAYFGVNGRSAYIEDDGVKIALHGYCCYTSNPVGIREGTAGEGIHPLAADTVVEDIRADEREGFQTVLSFHWGEEHVHYPRPDHIRLAHQLSKIRPLLIYGHHPHVLQGIESYEGSLIAYSLGNFCFDDVYTPKSDEPLVKMTRDNQQSMILSVEWDAEGIRHYEPAFLFFDSQSVERCEDRQLAADFHKWSAALAYTDEGAYRSMRARMIADRIAQRKTQRDFQWYWKRLRLDSLINIVNARKNRRKYAEAVTRYLDRPNEGAALK